jgi:hypothetical protein
MHHPGLSPMRLISYVKNPIGYLQSDGKEYITIDGVGGLKAVSKGRGILYSWVQGVGRQAALNCQFASLQMTQAEYATDEPGRISLELEAQPRTPCSGLRTSTCEGYIISPAYKLEPIEGRSIVLLILAPKTTPYSVEVEKSVLTISKDESEVTVTSDGGEVRCSGGISGQTKAAHIILNRNPGLPVYRAGFNQTISELKGQGEINASWSPVARSFEEHVIAFSPASMDVNRFAVGLGSLDLESIAGYLGAPEFEYGELDDYVIGDGPGVNYTLRLRIDRGLERHDSDETRLRVI